MNVAEFERYLGMVAQLLPAPDHTFDAPQIPAVPSEADVRVAVQRLIELEQIAAELPDRLRYIDNIGQSLAYTYNAEQADDLQDQRYWDATFALSAVRESYVEFQQLITQQIGHWQAAVAVMEHDIAWQQATGAQTRSRPSIAATMARTIALAAA